MNHRVDIIAELRQQLVRSENWQSDQGGLANAHHLKIGIKDIDKRLSSGLVLNSLHEVRCSLSRDIGCSAGFLLGLLARLPNYRPVVWVTDPSLLSDRSMLFPDGLAAFGFDPKRFFHIQPVHLKDTLWAAGEALKTNALAAVIIHLKGNPKAFDLSVSRKLMLRAQVSGIPIFVLRQAGKQEASSAVTRWHIRPAASPPSTLYHKAVGAMSFHLTLERNRSGPTGQWSLCWNPQARSFEHAPSTHSSLPFHPSSDRSDHSADIGQVMAFDARAQKAC